MGELVNKLKSMYSKEKNTLDANKCIKDYLAKNDDKHNNMVFYECKNEFNDLYQELSNNLSGEIKIMNNYIKKYNTELYKIYIDSQNGINEYTAEDWRNDLNNELGILQKKNQAFFQSNMRKPKNLIPTVISFLLEYDKRKIEIYSKIEISKKWRESHTLFQKIRMLTTRPSQKKDKNPSNDPIIGEKMEVMETEIGNTKVKTFISKDDSENKNIFENMLDGQSQVGRDSNHLDYNKFFVNRQNKVSEPVSNPDYIKLIDKVDFMRNCNRDFNKIGYIEDENKKNLSTQPCGPNMVNKNNYNFNNNKMHTHSLN